jgi:hypothetical protein
VMVATTVAIEIAPVIETLLAEDGPIIEDVAAATLEEAAPAIEKVVAEGEQAISEAESTYLRGGDRPPTNPKFWELRDVDRDTENYSQSGMSTFKKPPATPKYLLSSNPKTSSWWDRVVEIPSKLPSNLEWTKTSTKGLFEDPVLDDNHFVLRDPGRLASMPWEDYKNWWNTDMVKELVNWSKNWAIHSK